jgi:hypothetical protein
MKRYRSLFIKSAVVLGFIAIAVPAVAGPPLLCHPFEIEVRSRCPGLVKGAGLKEARLQARSPGRRHRGAPHTVHPCDCPWKH